MVWVRPAASRTFCTAGSNSAIRIAMIAITTRSSISVNPDRFSGLMAGRSLGLLLVLGNQLRQLKGIRLRLFDRTLFLDDLVPGNAHEVEGQILGHVGALEKEQGKTGFGDAVVAKPMSTRSLAVNQDSRPPFVPILAANLLEVVNHRHALQAEKEVM